MSRPKGSTAYDHARILALHDGGMPSGAIAERMGCSRRTVNRAIRGRGPAGKEEVRMGARRGGLALRETTARKNWPGRPMPPWVDGRTRLYTGFKVEVAGQEWRQILVHYDGRRTTAYVTHNGFDLGLKGPSLWQMGGPHAEYRKVVAQWFREFHDVEVSFA